MFADTKLKSYAELLGLETAELENFMKRYKSYILSKNEITKNILINGLFILEEIHSDKWAIEANRIKYKTKNLLIIKYMEKILELYHSGVGTMKISKHLKLNHRVDLSKSALDRFISTNKIKRSL